MKNIYFHNQNNIIPTIILADQVSIPAPNCHFTRKPTEYILYVVTEGKMTIKEDDRSYTLQQGDCIILDPTRTHSGVTMNSSVTYSFIHFSMDCAEDILDNQEFTREHIQTQLTRQTTDSGDDIIWFPKTIHLSSPLMDSAMKHINEIIYILKSSSAHQKLKTGCEFIKVLLLLEKALAKKSKTSSIVDNRVLDLINYLKKHYNEDIHSKDIADTFFNHYDYLNRIFKKQTGQTIFSYINECRINESKRLLHSFYLTNREIAEKVGFHNEFYFSKVFKQYTGVSPKEYKKGISQKIL